jgi:signal peptidase II
VTYFRFWVFFVIVLGADLATKSWVVKNSVDLRNTPIVVLDWIEGHQSFLEFTYITNPGAAWSMFSDYPQVLTVLAGVALISIFIFRRTLELNKPSLQIIFGLICGGIAGNLSDRIFRKPAEVVDFIDIFIPWISYDYPIFNIADSGIFIGAFGYLFLGLRDSRRAKLHDNVK